MEWEKETRRTKDAQGKTMQRSRHKTTKANEQKLQQRSSLCAPIFTARKIMYSMHEQEQNAVKGNV